MNCYKLDNISFAYDKQPILKDISLSIESGDFIGICGPNGSGKSTLLKILAGLLDPLKGEILFDEKKLGNIARNEYAKLVAYVPQESEFAFPFTVSEVVLTGRSPYLGTWGFEKQEDTDIAIDAMKSMDVLQFADRTVHELSGGEKQRVIIARALAQQTQAILLDEPTSFLDIKHQKEIFSILQKLNSEKNQTVIAVIHDLNAAARYCNKIILLKSGSLHAYDDVAKVVIPETIKDVYDVDIQLVNVDNRNVPIIISD